MHGVNFVDMKAPSKPSQVEMNAGRMRPPSLGSCSTATLRISWPYLHSQCQTAPAITTATATRPIGVTNFYEV